MIINSVISGSGGSSKQLFYRYINNSGTIEPVSCTLTGNEFNGISEIASEGLAYSFCDCYTITGSLNLSSIYYIGSLGLRHAFSGSGITSVDLSGLTSLSSQGALDNAFYNCSHLTDVNISKLRSIGLNCFLAAFAYCTALTSITFNALNSLDSGALDHCFNGASNLADIYFPALKTTSFGYYTDQFYYMLGYTGTTTTHTLHFPSNLEATIQGLDQYPLFGGTSGYVVLAFDLPATS